MYQAVAKRTGLSNRPVQIKNVVAECIKLWENRPEYVHSLLNNLKITFPVEYL